VTLKHIGKYHVLENRSFWRQKMKKEKNIQPEIVPNNQYFSRFYLKNEIQILSFYY